MSNKQVIIDKIIMLLNKADTDTVSIVYDVLWKVIGTMKPKHEQRSIVMFLRDLI